LKIVQVTDCHVSADPHAEYRGFDPRASLESLVEPLRAWAPDLVLATGDLSEDASDASYAWLAETLSGLRAPILAIPGNHDDPAVMRPHFPDTAVNAPLVLEQDGWQLVLLNSATPDAVPGRFDERQLALLDHALADSAYPKLVALHHQPLAVGSPWIDQYPLLDPGAFWSVLDRHPAVKLVIWGHVHQAVSLKRGGIMALGSPSTVCNSLPDAEVFTPDPGGPACRWLKLMADGGVETGLLGAP